MSEEFDQLIDDGMDALTDLEEAVEGVDSLDGLDADGLERVTGNLDTLARVATELEDVLEAIDLSELPDAVDGDELLEAVDVGEIPEALGDGDLGDAVDGTKLFDALELMNAWNAAELGDLWSEASELSDAVDALSDDDDSLAGKAASAVIDDDGDDEMLDMDVDKDDMTDALGDIDVLEDPEAYQVAIQQQAMKGIDGVRDALLVAHEKFEKLYEFNRERMRRQDRETNSRNPTAVSTMPIDRRDLEGGTRHATVPQDVRLSTAPSRKRVYGRRFEIERERRGLADGGGGDDGG